MTYDAFLLVSFGGPEGRDDVMPFLRNVVRGRKVPEERLRLVAEHYDLFDGVSPINGENRRLLRELERELSDLSTPWYWGNRNWHPFLSDTLRRMAEDGVKRALALVTSAYSSYSSCRQYLEDVERARAEVGASAPVVEKLRPFFNHPGFIEANRERLASALLELEPESRDRTPILFTAHSLPLAMARASDYVRELEEVRSLVGAGLSNPSRLVYQSRSGSPRDPWLEPDVLDVLKELAAGGARAVIAAPIGFLSDHMEVVYDLDVEASRLADRLGVRFVRAGTVASHPRFPAMVRELVEERLSGTEDRDAVGNLPALPDVCPPGCCLERTPVIE